MAESNIASPRCGDIANSQQIMQIGSIDLTAADVSTPGSVPVVYFQTQLTRGDIDAIAGFKSCPATALTLLYVGPDARIAGTLDFETGAFCNFATKEISFDAPFCD